MPGAEIASKQAVYTLQLLHAELAGKLRGDAIPERHRRAAAAKAPVTAREIADTLVAGNTPQVTRKQAADLQVAILHALRKRNGR
jgi:hypothetical protein